LADFYVVTGTFGANDIKVAHIIVFQAAKLAKAEATIDKYQKKIEEMMTLKKQVRFCRCHNVTAV
jgi:hypothetical protein